MRCPYCGAEVSRNRCEYCDSELIPEKSVYEQEIKYVEVTKPETEEVSKKNKTACAVLCGIGFFRVAGLHRFYCGKVGSGLLYLCTFGLFFVGTLVDFILIISGKFKDKNGKIIK